ncbi:MAG: hypothetical protein M0R73_11045 [Dehalococcoidia bacterium]|nr:hypothetical protein [Dehalococcoidia bacterium]
MAPKPDEPRERGDRFDLGAALAGVTFAVLGVLFLLDATDMATLRFEIILPAIAIALGASMILGALLRDQRSG